MRFSHFVNARDTWELAHWQYAHLLGSKCSSFCWSFLDFNIFHIHRFIHRMVLSVNNFTFPTKTTRFCDTTIFMITVKTMWIYIIIKRTITEWHLSFLFFEYVFHRAKITTWT